MYAHTQYTAVPTVLPKWCATHMAIKKPPNPKTHCNLQGRFLQALRGGGRSEPWRAPGAQPTSPLQDPRKVGGDFQVPIFDLGAFVLT